MARERKRKLTKEEKRRRRTDFKARTRRDAREHPVLFGTYFILRALVIVIIILQAFNGNYYDVFICGLTLVLFLIPSFVEKRLHIDVPNTLEVIILLFIFAAEILGELQEYYLIIPFWDDMLHTVNGFMMAAVGFAMVDVLNRSEKFRIRLSPLFVGVVAFCFSMTIGVLWEFFEYFMDSFFVLDMQKDTWVKAFNSVSLHPEGRNSAVHIDVESVVVNGEEWPAYLDIGLHDTMKDLFVNFIGAFVFSIIGVLYTMGRSRTNFAARFIPRLKKNELPPPDDENPGLFQPVELDKEERAPVLPAKAESAEERFDIYTVDGVPTGRTAAKDAPCTGDDYWLGVHMYLYDGKGRFLLQQRALCKSERPGMWDTHMGHVKAGETSIAAARRELQEELGLSLPPEKFVHIYRQVWREENHLLDIYFVREDVDETRLVLQAEEVAAVKWVTKEEMCRTVQTMRDRTDEYREAVLRYIGRIS